MADPVEGADIAQKGGSAVAAPDEILPASAPPVSSAGSPSIEDFDKDWPALIGPMIPEGTTISFNPKAPGYKTAPSLPSAKRPAASGKNLYSACPFTVLELQG